MAGSSRAREKEIRSSWARNLAEPLCHAAVPPAAAHSAAKCPLEGVKSILKKYLSKRNLQQGFSKERKN